MENGEKEVVGFAISILYAKGKKKGLLHLSIAVTVQGITEAEIGI